MKKPINHAILLLGGLGTRFLPITKSLPKAMLPIVDRPCFEFLMKEIYEAGLRRVTLVLGPNMEMIQDYIQAKPDWENTLETRGLQNSLRHWHFYREMNIDFVIQHEALGDGDAILQCQPLLEDEEAFAILFGDDLIFHEKGALTQLLEAYEKKPSHTLAVIPVPREEVYQYGIIGSSNLQEESMVVEALHEKPHPDEAPSTMAIIGKYIVEKSIWKQLEKAKHRHEQEARPEFRLIEALEMDLLDGKAVFAQRMEGLRFDTGSKKGWLDANCFIAGR